MATASTRILTRDQAESKGWDVMVAEHPNGSVYHHTAFADVVSRTFRHTEPYFVSLVDDCDHLRGGLLVSLVRSWLTGNRLVSIPWACYADPMVALSRRVQAAL